MFEEGQSDGRHKMYFKNAPVDILSLKKSCKLRSLYFNK